jgi:hypothetical protein
MSDAKRRDSLGSPILDYNGRTCFHRGPIMSQELSFGEVLDAADHLSRDEQEELVAILNRRLADARRRQLIADVEESRREFAEGRCVPTTVDDLMREISR